MKTYAFYISNHGFGHIMRNIPVMSKMLESEDTRIVLVSDTQQLCAARKYIEHYMKGITGLNERFICIEQETDYGTPVIAGTLQIDRAALERGVQKYTASFEKRIEGAKEIFKKYGVCCVVCDIVPWALTASRETGIPSFLMASFTWIDVFEEYLDKELIVPYIKCFNDADNVLLLSLANEPTRKRYPDGIQVGLSVRPFNCAKARQIRKEMSKPVVFISIGGSNSGLKDAIDVSGLPYEFIVTSGIRMTGENVHILPQGTDDTHNYVAASDFCISKPGWSTLAEILLAGKPAALIGRPDIAEDRMNIKMMKELNAAIEITVGDLQNMGEVLERLQNAGIQKQKFSNDYERIAAIITGSNK